MFHLVVAWDGNVNVTQRRVSVAQGNDRDVDVRSFNDWLVIGTWIHNNQQTRLAESGLDLVSERTRGEASSNGGCLGVGGKLESGTLALRTRRDDEDISRVLNSYNSPCSQKKLLVSPAQVDDVNT